MSLQNDQNASATRKRSGRLLRRALVAGLVFLNVLSFILLARAGLSYWHEALFYGLDGSLEASVIAQSVAAHPALGFANDVLRGLGNIQYPINAALIPAYRFAFAGWDGSSAPFVLTFTICATELFVAIFLLGISFRFPAVVSLMAAWAVSLVTWQIISYPPLIANTWRGLPNYAEVAAISLMIPSAFLHVGRRGLVTSIALSLGIFASLTYVILTAPPVLILATPFPVAVSAVALVFADTRNERITKVVAAVAIFLACYLFGYLDYLHGILGYTAASVFKGISIQPGTLPEISMLYWSRLGEEIVLGAFLGGIITVVFGRGDQRIMAFGTLGLESLFFCIGYAHYLHPFWYLPALWYFEGFLLPALALLLCFGAYIVVTGACRGALSLARRFTPIGIDAFFPTVAALIGVAVIPWAYTVQAHRATSAAGGPIVLFAAPYPQKPTVITEQLEKEISLSTEESFRGRVAVLMGRMFPQAHDWGSSFGHMMLVSALATRNYNEETGLWQYGIPTLAEINQLMSPSYWAFNRIAFTEADDVQSRNFEPMRRFDARLLAAIGARFVVTDAPINSGATLRARLKIPVPDFFRTQILPGLFKDVPAYDIYLYEVGNANIGQYTPVESQVVGDAGALLRLIADPNVDFSRTVLSQEPLPTDLVPAKLGSLDAEPGRLKLKATSAGNSVLVIPFEFSRCMSLISAPASDPHAHLFRANLAMTGILFHRQLNASIEYFTGPFHNQRCRLKDLDDMAAMNMKHAFESFPAYAP